jgi:hypothetical protein
MRAAEILERMWYGGYPGDSGNAPTTGVAEARRGLRSDGIFCRPARSLRATLLLAACLWPLTPCRADTHYVALTGGNVAPYTNWATAATTIQSAINAAAAGDMVLVTNGIYSNGAMAVYNASNRVAVTKPVTVRSVNGPAFTVIVGRGPLGSNAIRCVYLGTNSSLHGFTLTNGFTKTSGDNTREESGGGVWCEKSAVVSNCVIVRNFANKDGGGALGGTLIDCIVRQNTAGDDGGGVAGSSVVQSMIITNQAGGNGGGAFDSVLDRCIVRGNSASSGDGGGMYGGFTRSSLITSNLAKRGGGVYVVAAGVYGAFDTLLESSTVVGNSSMGFDGTGGGVYLQGGVGSVRIRNSIVYFNSSSGASNWVSDPGDINDRIKQTCTAPLPTGGGGNISFDPDFQNMSAGDYRLKSSSGCRNSGENREWMFSALDLDGNDRIFDGTVDRGALEYAKLLSLRFFLQGAYNTNSSMMSTSLVAVLPPVSPYAADPRKATGVPSNTTDWILVELRSSSNAPAAFVRSAFLGRNGSVLTDVGTTGLTAAVTGNTYYALVHHRNHVSAMSASPLSFLGDSISYDFTTGTNKYFGGSNATVQLKGGVFGLIAGDADGDGQILTVDTNIWQTQSE